jgi:hypothetical protein
VAEAVEDECCCYARIFLGRAFDAGLGRERRMGEWMEMHGWEEFGVI